MFGALISAAKSYIYNPLFMKKGKQIKQFAFLLVVLSVYKNLIRIAKIATF